MAGKILIVDDVATNRIVLKVKLSSARYDILQADTGAEALRIASQDRPDLILLNVQLAGMDGLETCRRLKRAPASAAIPASVWKPGGPNPSCPRGTFTKATVLWNARRSETMCPTIFQSA